MNTKFLLLKVVIQYKKKCIIQLPCQVEFLDISRVYYFSEEYGWGTLIRK